MRDGGEGLRVRGADKGVLPRVVLPVQGELEAIRAARDARGARAGQLPRRHRHARDVRAALDQGPYKSFLPHIYYDLYPNPIFVRIFSFYFLPLCSKSCLGVRYHHFVTFYPDLVKLRARAAAGAR